jgi:shikimate kinase
MENIILLGYMGSGKTTIGKKLAKKLGILFEDLDNLIEKKEKISISELFSTKGEIYFRRVEHQVLKEVISSKNPKIISLGGGTPCYAGNMDIILKSNSTSIYLKTNIDEIIKRVENQSQKRPILASIEKEDRQEFIAKQLFERSFYYNQANFVVETSTKSIDEIVSEIEAILS